MDDPDPLEALWKDHVEKLAASQHCLFCTRLWKSVLDFYARLPYDLVHDRNKRREFSGEGALCHSHLWQLASMASSTTMSLLLAEIAGEATRGLSTEASCYRKSPRLLRKSTDLKDSCRVCAYTKDVETQLQEEFKKLLAKPEGLAAFQKSNGFCLRHTRLIIDGLEEELATTILTHAAGRLSELSRSLSNSSQQTGASRTGFVRHDGRPTVSRALIQLGGTKYLHFFPLE